MWLQLGKLIRPEFASPDACSINRNRRQSHFPRRNFDAIGRWRASDSGAVIDPKGKLFNGADVAGPQDLRAMLTARPETFVGVGVERLLTYALGRGLEYTDMPLVRQIVNTAAPQNFRFSALILGVVKSPAFSMKEGKTQIAQTLKPQQ